MASVATVRRTGKQSVEVTTVALDIAVPTGEGEAGGEVIELGRRIQVLCL